MGIQIHELTTKSGTLSNSDNFVSDNGTVTTKVPFNSLAQGVVRNFSDSTLTTSAKTVVGAINEAISKGLFYKGDESTDLNNISSPGIYRYTASPLNRPDSASYGTVIFIQANNYYIELLISGLALTNQKLFYRTKVNASADWSEWQGVFSENYINTTAYHNSVYTGKSLGTEITTAQWDAISSGEFTNMFIGDYWTLNGRVYRIGHFDPHYYVGDNPFTKHHIDVVPDGAFANVAMNPTDTTAGGYVGSQLRQSGMDSIRETIKSAFGESHVLSHREYLCNAVTDGKESGGAWFDSDGIEIMSEIEVFGTKILNTANVFTSNTSQLRIMALRSTTINIRISYWLRDAFSAGSFALVSSYGYVYRDGASATSRAVRPRITIG